MNDSFVLMARALLWIGVLCLAAGCEQLFPPHGEDTGSAASSGSVSGTGSSSGTSGEASTGTSASSTSGTTASSSSSTSSSSTSGTTASSTSASSSSSGSSTGGTTSGCGDLGQRCCNQTDCNDGGLYCDTYQCVSYRANWPMPNPAGSTDPVSGALLPNQASYGDGGAGIVVDNVTGLMWQQAASFKLSATIAANSCVAITLGGYRDWRVPTALELFSLFDYTRSSPGPMIDPAAFPGTPTDAGYWSSTPLAGDSSQAWYVDFASAGGTFADVTSSSGYVRCVRGTIPPPASRYAAGSGTLYDNATGLTWQQPFNSALVVHWGDAGVDCASLNLNGTGWRVPSVKELMTTVDLSIADPGPVIDPAFANTTQSTFWTSSQLNNDPTPTAWIVNFRDGSASAFVESAGNFFRCVR